MHRISQTALKTEEKADLRKSIFAEIWNFEVHSRFPITKFPVTKPLCNKRVTPPYNEQTIDPSSPITTEWSALEFKKVINEFDGFYHKLMRKLFVNY